MRPGVATHLELLLDGGAEPQLAIPSSAVVRDGLETVIFKRNPEEPDEVLRIPVEVLLQDGPWTVVQGEVERGDEVVREGAYELKLALDTGGNIPKGGHMHADGTFHAE